MFLMPDDDATNIIYAIVNKANGKMYIGKTIKSFKARYYRGLEKHHNPHLRKSIKKYGIDNFEVRILERNIEDVEILNSLEVEYIEKFKTHDPEFGYNKTFGGEGVQHTPETRAKTSRALKGKTKSKEHCENIRKSKLGIDPLSLLSDEAKAIRNKKISEALKGKNNPNFNNAFGKKRAKKSGKTSRKGKYDEIVDGYTELSYIEKQSYCNSGERNNMYGKNIKDYMTPESYEQWKKNVARPGELNGRAREAVIVYKNKVYEFSYAQKGIDYFKNEMKTPITRNWFYKGVNPKYKEEFQFVGYKDDYLGLCL